jgi:Zn-dependent protease
MAALWSVETAIVIAVLLAAVAYAMRPRQQWRIDTTIRAFREDVWRAMSTRRGEPPHLDIIDRYEFDDGSDDSGIMAFKNGMRLRFETFGVRQADDVWAMAWRSVPVDSAGAPAGDPYETFMELREVAEGTAVRLVYMFYKGDTGGFKAWFSRLLRPLTRAQAGATLRMAAEKSGALARFEAAHGPAPAPQTVAGVPLTGPSLALFAAGAASFMWLGGFWTGVALLFILVLHELGHVLAMRAYGDRTSAFYLIPFMGGVAIGQKPLASDWQLVVMVLAGPFAGLLTALAALGLHHLTDDDWFAAVALLAAFVNLFNLAPVPMLDGGQVMFALLRRYVPHGVLHWAGIVLLLAAAALAAWLGSTLLLVLLGLMATVQAVFPTPASVNPRALLGHGGAIAGALLFASLVAALLAVATVISIGDAYPAAPLRFLSAGPFSS